MEGREKKSGKSGCNEKDEERDFEKLKEMVLKEYEDKAQALRDIEERLNEIKSGKFEYNRKKVKCYDNATLKMSGKSSGNCKNIIKLAEKCKNKRKVVHKKNSKDESMAIIRNKCTTLDMRENKIAVALYNQHLQMKNNIISNDPLLASQVVTHLPSKSRELWKVLRGGNRKESLMKQAYKDRMEKKRNLIVDDICKKPIKFAKDMILNHREVLYNQYFKNHSDPKTVKRLLCQVKEQEYRKLNTFWGQHGEKVQYGVTLGLSVLANRYTGGKAGKAIKLLSKGMNAYETYAVLNQLLTANTNLNNMRGRIQGCIGDYLDLYNSQVAYRKAVMSAAMGLGYSPSSLLKKGVSKAQRLQELRRLGKKHGLGRKYFKQISKAEKPLKQGAVDKIMDVYGSNDQTVSWVRSEINKLINSSAKIPLENYLELDKVMTENKIGRRFTLTCLKDPTLCTKLSGFYKHASTQEKSVLDEYCLGLKRTLTLRNRRKCEKKIDDFEWGNKRTYSTEDLDDIDY